jgi:hypothetical protein
MEIYELVVIDLSATHRRILVPTYAGIVASSRSRASAYAVHKPEAVVACRYVQIWKTFYSLS